MNISDDPKSVKVSIRFTDEEIEYLEKKALDSNCIWNKNPCISQFIRLCVLNEGKVYIYKEFKPILMQIRKIGTNLNQIAKLANMHKIEEVYLQECQKELAEIVKMLERISKQLPNNRAKTK